MPININGKPLQAKISRVRRGRYGQARSRKPVNLNLDGTDLSAGQFCKAVGITMSAFRWRQEKGKIPEPDFHDHTRHPRWRVETVRAWLESQHVLQSTAKSPRCEMNPSTMPEREQM